MSCLSDIDLATLHRTRLEERVHYKLSWWTRRRTDKQTINNAVHQSQQIKNLNRTTNVTIISQQIESECIENRQVVTATRIDRIDGVDATTTRNTHTIGMDATNGNGCIDDEHSNCGSRQKQHQIDHERHLNRLSYMTATVDDCIVNGRHDLSNNNDIDIDHFPILRRRRSGTWP